MGEIWIWDIDITTLMAVGAVFLVIPVQLLLCAKGKKTWIKRLPSIVLAVTTAVFFIMMYTARDWDAIGYAILGVFSGVLLIVSGFAWGVWFIIRKVKKRKNSKKMWMPD